MQTTLGMIIKSELPEPVQESPNPGECWQIDRERQHNYGYQQVHGKILFQAGTPPKPSVALMVSKKKKKDFYNQNHS